MVPGPGVTDTTPAGAEASALFGDGAGRATSGAACFFCGLSIGVTDFVSTGASPLLSSCADEGAADGSGAGEAASGRGLLATVVGGSEEADAGAEFRPTT